MQHLYGHYDNRGICFVVYVVIFTPIFLVNCFLGFDYYFSIFIFFNVHVFFWPPDCVEEIDAQRVFGYALFKDGRNTKLAYPLEKFHSDVAGRSFHHGRFIQRMRQKAATLPK